MHSTNGVASHATQDLFKERNWYILWAPAGFGRTTSVIESIQNCLRLTDGEAIVWYPIQVESFGGTYTAKPIYPGYMFVHCTWTSDLDKTVSNACPAGAFFLKDSVSRLPKIISPDTITEVKTFVSEVLRNPEMFLSVEGLAVGTKVEVLKRSFFGLTGTLRAFLPRNRALVEIVMFQREVLTALRLDDLRVI